MSYCKEMIRLPPNGHDTILTDTGSSLRQGQRQLFAISEVVLFVEKGV